MKESIKKRIEAVRRGEVPEGYRIENGYLIPNDWKTVPLNRRFTRSTRKNKSGCENVLTISAQMGLVNQREFYDKDIASEDKSGYLLMKNGEFAYNKSYSTGYPYGVIKQLTKYDEGIVSPLYICFAPNAGTNTAFYTQYFEGGRYNREIYRVAQEGARNHGLLNVSVEDFFEGTLVEPSAYEQQKIAEILATCDRMIELKQRKIDELNKLKQVCLLEMFPKEGQAVPEIRFKGFTAPWEQRKLNEVVNVYDGVHRTPDYKDSGVMFLSVENISTLKSEKYISEEAFQRDYEVYPQKGDILMTRIGDVGTPNVVETTEKVAFYVSLALLKPTKINSYFLCNSIQSPLFQKGLKDRTLVTAIPQKINKDEIGKVNIILPTSSQEQQLIGEYFRNLDNLITLHQRILEEEKRKKKALMQLLLTGLVRVNA